MEPAAWVALSGLTFAASHIALASHPLRRNLAERLGELGFIVFYSVVAAGAFAWWMHTAAVNVHLGAPGLALGHVGWIRVVCFGAIGGGLALVLAGLVAYPTSPMAMFGGGNGAPRGMERITRHAFLVGMALLGFGHVPLATHLSGTVLFATLGIFAIVGARHQDQKLLGIQGQSYADYMRITSGLPFAAVLGGRQRLVLGELPWLGLAGGVALAFVLRSVHASIFAHGGAFVIAAVVGGAGVELVLGARRMRRHAARADTLAGAA